MTNAYLKRPGSNTCGNPFGECCIAFSSRFILISLSAGGQSASRDIAFYGERGGGRRRCDWLPGRGKTSGICPPSSSPRSPTAGSSRAAARAPVGTGRGVADSTPRPAIRAGGDGEKMR
ncbi:Hypothetical predicted protein [Pelobates cultripes]|uniref:Uncharacterized protein n=1 Tax=Pelobates cultripes TaxID=61616 RepID=A0AAD1REW2_PELCU|nr:Hypothetical predicted protein [Pelobates cultripes]